VPAPAPRSAGRPAPARGECLGHCARTTGGVKVAAAWWSGLAAKPALQGDGPPSPGGSLPAVALTAKAMEGS